jgi:hypothetical protein
MAAIPFWRWLAPAGIPKHRFYGISDGRAWAGSATCIRYHAAAISGVTAMRQEKSAGMS